MQKSWECALKKAKIQRRLRPYDLRHYFVTRCLEEGADLKAVSEVVGSRPDTLWRHYQHVSRDLRRRAVAAVPGGRTASLAINNSQKP
ncbi:tyrosine-type recombinase/integrase [Thermodesulfobacteriota bacterium]